MAKKSKTPENVIAQNRKARFDYQILETYEAGLVLEGWEVKSLRAGKVQINDSHIIVKRGEAWLLGGLIQPLPTASRHHLPDPSRTRKLLLHRRELDKLIGAVEREGYTLVPLSFYWKHNRAKVNVALVKGKKNYDKRETQKQRDWQRDKARLLKRH